MDKLKDVMFALPPDAYLGLPSIVPVVRKVKLPKPMLEEYKRFKRTLVTEMYDVEAVNSAVLVNKLLQFANGSLYQEVGVGVHVHDLKLKVLEELVEELDGQPLLVAYSFKFDLERIKKKFKKAVVLSESQDVRATVKKWNAGKIEMLIAHPLSSAHGLNLQHGGNQACWYGLNGDLELYQQFNKRLARSGQKEDRVFLHHIVAEGTHDERILPILADRAATQDDVLRAVQIELINK